MTVRVIIGGPPNSGKSTLAVSVAMALRQFGVDVNDVDLDLATRTIDYIKGTRPWKRRSQEKKEWTAELAKEAAEKFKEASMKQDVVIGDAPGKISDVSRRIAQEASHAIICCRDDCADEIEKWKSFFESLGIEIVAIITLRWTV